METRRPPRVRLIGLDIEPQRLDADIGLAHPANVEEAFTRGGAAICRKLGFTQVGVTECEYPPGSGTILRCNDWRLDLSPEA